MIVVIVVVIVTEKQSQLLALALGLGWSLTTKEGISVVTTRALALGLIHKAN